MTTATISRPTESPVELAERHGLAPSSARPPFGDYVRQLWQRRYFIARFATSRTATLYSSSRLGHVWQVLTPLLNAGVYYLFFGLLFQAGRGVENFVAFLVTGVFVFHFTSRSVSAGARAISGNLSLIRALHFPRASLPFASTIVELQQLMVSMAVLSVIVLATGEPLTWYWLLIVPALALQTIFNMGLSLILARIGAKVPDISQLLPFVTRTWLYLSGILYSIPDRVGPGLIRDLMMANPAAVYIELVRDALMDTHEATTWTWYLAVAWALVIFCAGFWYFWQAEERYGRG
jgi:teichoic acid transport system permease protein